MFDRKRVERVMYVIAGTLVILMLAVLVVGMKMMNNYEEQAMMLNKLESQTVKEQKESIVENEPVFLVGANKYIPTKEINVTIDVFDMLSERIAFEASDDIKEMYAVGAVILNRVESDKFPDTVEEVLNQKNQFTQINQSMKYDEHMRNARAVASDLLYNNYRPLDSNVLMFRTTGFVKESEMTQENAVYQTTNMVFFTLD